MAKRVRQQLEWIREGRHNVCLVFGEDGRRFVQMVAEAGSHESVGFAWTAPALRPEEYGGDAPICHLLQRLAEEQFVASRDIETLLKPFPALAKAYCEHDPTRRQQVSIDMRFMYDPVIASGGTLFINVVHPQRSDEVDNPPHVVQQLDFAVSFVKSLVHGASTAPFYYQKHHDRVA
ncbi:hypothetical protein BD324DRAFT_630642 [Kockovaella imperatae]|uniref:Uncharacterized protein n=1 Tax=Kockovaella imperatae TaxID=4999 RepID=A0A1Y1UBZ7_9TREE|nr:hypothetical protein BD324DRAFT_630642 [Kockovaella imperatae]ORX35563.1 hypothetical protein BD324DRAFT_630642 [Kockovaella imperatae]